MKTFNGGAAANVACVGAKLGLKTSLVSAVGGDFKKTEYFLKFIPKLSTIYLLLLYTALPNMSTSIIITIAITTFSVKLVFNSEFHTLTFQLDI